MPVVSVRVTTTVGVALEVEEDPPEVLPALPPPPPQAVKARAAAAAVVPARIRSGRDVEIEWGMVSLRL